MGIEGEGRGGGEAEGGEWSRDPSPALTYTRKREMGSTNSKATTAGGVVGAVIGVTFSGAGAAVVLGAVVATASRAVAKNVSRAFACGERDKGPRTAKAAAMGAAVGVVSACVAGPIAGTLIASGLAFGASEKEAPPDPDADIEGTRIAHICAKAAVCTGVGMMFPVSVEVADVQRWPEQTVVPSIIGFLYEAVFDMPLGKDCQTLMSSQMLSVVCFSVIPFVLAHASTLGLGWALFHGYVNAMGPLMMSFWFPNALSMPISEYVEEQRAKEFADATSNAAQDLLDNVITRGDFQQRVKAAALHAQR